MFKYLICYIKNNSVLHAGDCQGNDGSHQESIGAPVKRYTSIMKTLMWASASIVICRRLFEEGASCSMNFPSKVPKMYVNHELMSGLFSCANFTDQLISQLH